MNFDIKEIEAYIIIQFSITIDTAKKDEELSLIILNAIEYLCKNAKEKKGFLKFTEVMADNPYFSLILEHEMEFSKKMPYVLTIWGENPRGHGDKITISCKAQYHL